jgi:formylmethanofuran dehydrogenase subunit E
MDSSLFNGKIKDPRRKIEEAVQAGELGTLLKMSGMLHGHFCPGSALGVKAGARAMRDLGVKSSTGMEEVIAIVEVNSCFSDGIQIVTGCTFGNNALIYRDLGKTAFTLAKRSGEGIRISVKPGGMEGQASEASRLFRQLINERKSAESDPIKVSQLQIEAAFKLLDVPDEEVFDIKKVKIKIPDYARIYASVKCSVCGENIMEPRARLKEGKPICLTCAGLQFFQLAGDGISTVSEKEN